MFSFRGRRHNFITSIDLVWVLWVSVDSNCWGLMGLKFAVSTHLDIFFSTENSAENYVFGGIFFWPMRPQLSGKNSSIDNVLSHWKLLTSPPSPSASFRIINSTLAPPQKVSGQTTRFVSTSTKTTNLQPRPKPMQTIQCQKCPNILPNL